MGKQRMFFKVAVLGVALLGAAAFLFRERILLAVGDDLVIRDELEPADVIHVIAGDDYRTDYAIQLYQQGYGKILFFTGGWCRFHGYNHGDHALQRALAQGVPPAAIVSDDAPVKSTYDEIVLLKAYLNGSQSGMASVLIVSDPFHMRRARWTARQVLAPGTTIRMAPVPFEATPYSRRWWEDPLSRRYVADEYAKQAYYWMRYRLGWEWLAAFDVD